MSKRHWLHLLLRPTCVFCRQAKADGSICRACLDDLPALGRICRRCADPLASGVGENVTCGPCQARPPPWTRCRAALPYEWPVDVALQRLKYSRELAFAAAFGALLAMRAAADFAGVDALCAVPLHRWRHLRRGFNQAEELLIPIRRQTGLPVIRGLRRTRSTRPQSGLSRTARRQNLRGAFRMSENCLFRHPLVVDDIMTTGETCRQVASVLLANGARNVSVLTVARAASRDYGVGPAKV